MSKKVVVDAGHGGNDPGASSYIIEKEYNLKIANYIYNKLREKGVPVSITRSDDVYLSPSERVNKIVNFYGNGSDVIVLSNHLNAGGGDGAEVVYALRNNDTLSKLILENIGKQGQNIRKWYQRRLPSNPSKDYYFIHRETGNTEPVLIEYGFVDNRDDALFIRDNWQKLAQATVNAVLSYLGIPTDDNEGIYIVKKGDSLYSIAKKYNTSVADIKNLNNLSSNMISINQKLIIPNYNEDIDTYVVKKGDSLYSIANMFDTTVNKLKEINNLSSNVLNVGAMLTIPKNTVNSITDDDASPSNSYVVEYGDTLYSIAKNNNISLDELISLNNITDNTLYVGQILKIPTYAPNEILNSDEYKVVKGDSLYSIAKKYNTTVDNLKQLNNLTSNSLDAGDILKIPVVIESDNNTIYIVEKNDTLYSIARKYNITVSELKELNNLENNTLYVGQKIKISN